MKLLRAGWGNHLSCHFVELLRQNESYETCTTYSGRDMLRPSALRDGGSVFCCDSSDVLV